MASVSSEKRGGRTLYRIQFRDGDKKRKSIRLSGANKKTADAIASKVESLNACCIAGQPMPTDLAKWVVKLGDDLHAKLSNAGLVESRHCKRPTTLAAYVEDYLERKRPTVEPQTLRNYVPFAKVLCEHFGSGRRLDDISEGDADDFRTHLLQRYAEATMSKRIKQAREIFRQAVKDRIISESPFIEVKIGDEANTERQQYISVEDTLKVIEQAADAEQRLIIALARFVGLRTPSETRKLRWPDVNWEAKRILIHSPKTKRKGKPTRFCPLFPEVEPFLSEAFALAPEGSTHCITRRRGGNLRTQMYCLIDRAGLKRWPRVFHNLRASLETDLNDRFPAHVVAAWLGNTPKVADKHYNMTTDAHFARAIAEGGAGGGAASVRNDVQAKEVADEKPPENKGEAINLGLQLPIEYPWWDSAFFMLEKCVTSTRNAVSVFAGAEAMACWAM